MVARAKEEKTNKNFGVRKYGLLQFKIMSSFTKPTKNPKTGKIEKAEWLDDYFGNHLYGVRFSDGKVYRPEEISDEFKYKEE